MESVYNTSRGHGVGTGSLLGSSRSGFVSKLEKHLDDVQKNRGFNTRQVGAAVRTKGFEASKSLAQANLRASSNFHGYQTMMRYDQHSRFVNGVADSQYYMDKFYSAQGLSRIA